MAKSYTIKMQETPGSRWCYVDEDGNVVHDASRCKPLTLAEARKARRLMIEGALKAGRPINCKVVALAEPVTNRPRRLLVLQKTLARYLKP